MVYTAGVVADYCGTDRSDLGIRAVSAIVAKRVAAIPTEELRRLVGLVRPASVIGECIDLRQTIGVVGTL